MWPTKLSFKKENARKVETETKKKKKHRIATNKNEKLNLVLILTKHTTNLQRLNMWPNSKIEHMNTLQN